MEGIFQEFENENALRSYPFAEGCVPPEDEESLIPADVFVDAALYPVNPTGSLYLSSISEDGVFSISDDTGVIMTGSANGSRVDLYDVSTFTRHVGTLLASSEDFLTEFAERGSARSYELENTAFSSTCVYPVVIDGVTSLDVGETGQATGKVGFTNGSNDEIRVSSTTLDDGRQTLRFDVLPRPVLEANTSIRRIICVVDGRTPFRIWKSDFSYNTVVLTLNGIQKGDVCTAAHRENQYEMADTCDTPKESRYVDDIPEAYQLIEVYIPPDPAEGGVHRQGGVEDGAENAFYLVVPNLTGYDNPLSITLKDGEVVPNTDGIKTVPAGSVAELADGEFIDSVTSNGVILQVPGLSGGSV